VEFACENGVPYAIDFMNPAPDADLHSVGRASFDWIVNAGRSLAVKKAREGDKSARSCDGLRAWRRGSTYCCEEELRQEDRCEKERDWYLVPRGLYLDLGARMQHRFCTLALLAAALVAPLQAKQEASETPAALPDPCARWA